MNILNPKFRYTPVKDMGPDYLKRRFEQIRQEQKERERLEAERRLRGVIAMKGRKS